MYQKLLDPKSMIEIKREQQLGKVVAERNGAIRSNILQEFNMDKKNVDILLRQIIREKGVLPSYGLKYKYDGRNWLISHFVLEFGKKKVALIFYDQKRHLSVRQIHQIEKLVKVMKLQGALVVSHKIGIPALNEIERVNSAYPEPIISFEHFSSIKKRHDNTNIQFVNYA